MYRAGSGIWRVGAPGIASHAAGGGANGWWNNDGAISGITAAYTAIGAANVAASQVNLANPGTYDLTEFTGGQTPTFSATDGWSGWTTTKLWLPVDLTSPDNETNTIIMHVVPNSEVRTCPYGRILTSGISKSAGNWITAWGWDLANVYMNGDGRETGLSNDPVIFAINETGLYLNGSFKASLNHYTAAMHDSVKNKSMVFGAAREGNDNIHISVWKGAIKSVVYARTTSLSADDISTISSAMAALS